MRFSVVAERSTDGTLDATLFADGEVADEKLGLKDPNAVDKWAKGAAEDFRRLNLASPKKILHYEHSFSL